MKNRICLPVLLVLLCLALCFPTVASAETDSYIAAAKFTGEVAHRKIPPKTDSAIIINAMVIASST